MKNSRRWAFFLAVLLSLGCGELKGEGEACKRATDCPLPWVCCHDEVDQYGDYIPDAANRCEPLHSCARYMPFLQSGDPCGRGGSEACIDGLSCCPETLTCGPPGKCPSLPAPPETGGSGLACGADTDCQSGEICCYLSYANREGACSTVQECTTGNVPQPSQEEEPPSSSCTETLCGEQCVNLMLNPTHCGACNRLCPSNTFCAQGECVPR